jgi:hypothetical protein
MASMHKDGDANEQQPQQHVLTILLGFEVLWGVLSREIWSEAMAILDSHIIWWQSRFNSQGFCNVKYLHVGFKFVMVFKEYILVSYSYLLVG